jgi:hypothetical protein
MHDRVVHLQAGEIFPKKGSEVGTMSQIDIDSFGALLKEFRTRGRLTQQQLAENLVSTAIRLAPGNGAIISLKAKAWSWSWPGSYA